MANRQLSALPVQSSHLIADWLHSLLYNHRPNLQRRIKYDDATIASGDRRRNDSVTDLSYKTRIYTYKADILSLLTSKLCGIYNRLL